MFHIGLCLFLFHSGSRNQMESDRRTMEFFHNLLILSGTDEERTATVEAMNYFMEISDPTGALELLPGKMVKRLIRSRVLDRYRNSNGEFMVAVDAVHLHTRKGEHPNSTHKTVDGERKSFYYSLEAKLVSEDGMGLSLATVFIETEEEYDKEDCELKAFYRLEKVLKKRFPRLRMCLLLDSLYANQNVLRICERNNWAYFISFKEGTIPSVYKEAEKRLEKSPEQSVDHSPEPGVCQHISWVLNMKYEGCHFHILVCEETKIKEQGIEKKRYVWITDSRPNRNNAAKLVREARCRWVVEEMFNIQKNGGYELEHNYGTVGFAMKSYYYLLQIAHILHQLMVRSDLFPKLQRKFIERETPGASLRNDLLAVAAATALGYFKTIKNFVKRLAESFRRQRLSELATNPEAFGAIRVSFDTS